MPTLNILIIFLFIPGFAGFPLFATETSVLHTGSERIHQLRAQLCPGDGQNAIIWQELYKIDPAITAQELRTAVKSFEIKKMQLAHAWQYKSTNGEKELITSSQRNYQNLLRRLNKDAYYALYKLVNLFQHELTCRDVETYWKYCVYLKLYSDAYHATILLADKFRVSLECLETYQIHKIVDIFSFHDNVDPQKFKILEDFLLKKIKTELYCLLQLYCERGMDDTLLKFFDSHFAALVQMENINCYFSYIMAACLQNREYELGLRGLKNVEKSIEKYMWKALIFKLMDNRANMEISLTKGKDFIKKYPFNQDREEKALHTFLFSLLQNQINEAFSILDSITDSQIMFSCLIYLKQKTNAPLEQINNLVDNYHELYSIPFDSNDLGYIKTVIDTALVEK